MEVYLAYAWHCYDDARELVGIHATKAGAYHAARKRMFERISDHDEVWRGARGRLRGFYKFHWRVETAEVKE